MFGNRRVPGVVTIAAIAVAIGLLPLPYGYYMLLRLFLCVELGSKPLWSIINIATVGWFWMLHRRAAGSFR